MDIRHIKDCFFTLSGYMSNTFNFIKKKYKILLIVFCVYAVSNSIPIFLYAQNFSRFFQNLSLYDIDTVVTVVLIAVVLSLGYLVFFFFLHAFMKGIIFTQCRAYADSCQFSLTDSLSYVCKRLGAYITASLSAVLIYFGAVAALILYFLIVGLISAGLINYSENIFAVILILFGFIGYIAFLALVFFIALKLFFSLFGSLNYNYGGFTALKYSDNLTKNFKGKLFGYVMFFIAINIGISMLLNMMNLFADLPNLVMSQNDFSGLVINPWVSILSSIITLAVSFFSTIFFTFVFINMDSVKKKIPYALDPSFNTAQDCFDQYCMSNGIQKETVSPN